MPERACAVKAGVVDVAKQSSTGSARRDAPHQHRADNDGNDDASHQTTVPSSAGGANHDPLSERGEPPCARACSPLTLFLGCGLRKPFGSALPPPHSRTRPSWECVAGPGGQAPGTVRRSSEASAQPPLLSLCASQVHGFKWRGGGVSSSVDS
jgi:hypothetical protein